MNEQQLTREELEKIRRRKISSYISDAEEQLQKDIDNMRHASISGEYSEYNKETRTTKTIKVDKDHAKKQQERLEKSLRSLQEFESLVETVEYRREALYEAEVELVPLEVAKEQVDEKVAETHANDTDVFGRSQSKETQERIRTPYEKDRSRSLQPEVEAYEKALKELDKYLSSSDSAVRRDKNGRCAFSFFHLTPISNNPFRKNERDVEVINPQQYGADTLKKYLQDITHTLHTFDEKKEQREKNGYVHNEEKRKFEYKVETPEVDKIQSTIDFYESDKFHGVRIVVHGEYALEKMAKRERLLSSIDKALDRVIDQPGFERTKQALERLKAREEKEFAREREQFEKETGYSGIVAAIEKDKAIEQYAELIRKQRASRSEREEYLYGQELEKLGAELGLTVAEVSEARRRVDREEEAKRTDADLERSAQLAKEREKNERIDREKAAHEAALDAVAGEFRRGHFRAPDFTDTDYNEQQIAEETEQAEERFAEGVYEEAYFKAVKPGIPEPEERITDTEEYQEAERTREELRQGVISYLTKGGTKPGVVQSEVDMMVTRLMDEMDMTPEERALEALKREGTNGIDENTSVHDLNQAQRQLVDAQMHIEETTGITASLDKMSKAKKERARRDKEEYESSSNISVPDNSERRETDQSTPNFAKAKAGYEEEVSKRDQAKVERRGLLSRLKRKPASDQPTETQVDEVSNEETRGVHR